MTECRNCLNESDKAISILGTLMEEIIDFIFKSEHKSYLLTFQHYQLSYYYFVLLFLLLRLMATHEHTVFFTTRWNDSGNGQSHFSKKNPAEPID